MKDKIVFPRRRKGRMKKVEYIEYEEKVKQFGIDLQALEHEMLGKTTINEDEKTSSRGWCYLLQNFGTINKDEFEMVDAMITNCRKMGYMPINFVAADVKRKWYNVESLIKDYIEPKEYIIDWLEYIKGISERKDDIAFGESQKYYIQMRTEKIDLRNLFNELCKKYHIPVSNAAGWSDLNSWNLMAQRYKQAEEIGLIPVLLYHGDYDPMGLVISDKIKNNLKDLEKATSWNPDNLIVDRFGLSTEFIKKHKLLWINNLITGGKRNVGDIYERYKAGTMIKTGKKKDIIYDYEIKYIEKIGVRKCEANAVLTVRDAAIADCEANILKYLEEDGKDPFEIYNEKLEETRKETREILNAVNYEERILEIINDIKKL
jgi:hypothetical protein